MFSPFTKAESHPDWSGNYDFIDAALNTRHPHRVELTTLRRYRDTYTHHFNLCKEIAICHQAPLARIPCELDRGQFGKRNVSPMHRKTGRYDAQAL